jgi:hypothetical protein
VYHLEGEGIIWSRSLSSGGLCIIWRERISSRAGEYHLEGHVSSEVSSGGVCIIWKGRVSSGNESIIWRGMYHLEGTCIIWSRRVSSARVFNIWSWRLSSGAGEYHLEGSVSS